MKEKWKPVKGFEKQYMVSNLGRVKALEKVVFKKNSQGIVSPFRLKEKILKPDIANGYLKVCFCSNKKMKRLYVHHLVMEAFVGPRPKGNDVNHLDGIKTNSSLKNLEYCTRSENLIHSVYVTKTWGRKWNYKLYEEDIYQIRQLLVDGLGYREIALMFNVHRDNIYQIDNYKIWNTVI